MSPKIQLNRGLEQLNLTLTIPQQTQLLAYLDLLSDWNKTYNLTGIDHKEDMIAKHLLDSLSAHSFIVGDRIIDLGSGAGLPGIPLAIAHPHKQFVLIDSLQKRTRFLAYVTHELNLSNVTVICDRISDYRTDMAFDTLVARALANCATIVSDSWHLCQPEGRWVLLKGQDPTEECHDLRENTRLISIHSMKVPELDQKRHIVIVGKEKL